MTASSEQTRLRSSPLAAWTARLAAASAAAAHFSIREQPFVTQIDLRGDPGDAAFAAATRRVLGLALPAANRYAGDAQLAAIWLGPDQWLLTAPDGRNDALLAALGEALHGLHHAATDVSANRTVIEISGSDARPVLAKGCTLDLHAAAFAPPRAAQTLLARSQVILQCLDAAPVFRIYVRNSFAQYAAEWLIDAAAESAAAREFDAEHIAARFA
ncbi:MAG: sarcosine oxidase subunit gamma [Lautropia sp.]